MSITRLSGYTSDGYLRVEQWAIYALFAPIDKTSTLVKIGVTQNPFARAYEIHCGSPFPIKRAIWQYIGNKRTAFGTESVALQLMQAKKTRGEWLMFQLQNPEDKELFHASMRRAILGATKRPPEWREIDVKTVFSNNSREWHLKA